MRPRGAPRRGGRADQEALSDLLVVGLGGNLGGQSAITRRFAAAVRRLAGLGTLVSVSALYETEPWGPIPDQPPFLNAACALYPRAHLAPLEMLAALWSIERALGRRRPGPRFGPRPIDLDILVWGQRRIEHPALRVPHPRLASRLFALAPLIDVAGPDFVVPPGAPAAELRDRARSGRAGGGGSGGGAPG